LRQQTENAATVGVVNGLAWTSVGGEVMPVEAVAFPGKGNLEITGNLGDVMKESARLAKSAVRARLKEYGVEEDFFEKHDIHIHVPEGAVPKDGPSAGVALTCALMSAVSGKAASNCYAMTGEITLHGRVLPIGGVKEKLLAAYRMGITRILLPAENEKDLEQIDEKIHASVCDGEIENACHRQAKRTLTQGCRVYGVLGNVDAVHGERGRRRQKRFSQTVGVVALAASCVENGTDLCGVRADDGFQSIQ
jgi:ATP-dependent Lon protease